MRKYSFRLALRSNLRVEGERTSTTRMGECVSSYVDNPLYGSWRKFPSPSVRGVCVQDHFQSPSDWEHVRFHPLLIGAWVSRDELSLAKILSRVFPSPSDRGVGVQQSATTGSFLVPGFPSPSERGVGVQTLLSTGCMGPVKLFPSPSDRGGVSSEFDLNLTAELSMFPSPSDRGVGVQGNPLKYRILNRLRMQSWRLILHLDRHLR
jgi:hypothetical protein